MKSSRVSAGGVNAWLHFAVSDIGEPGTAYSGSKRCVLMSVYDRSKETVSGFWANAHRGIYLKNNVIYGPTDEPYKGFSLRWCQERRRHGTVIFTTAHLVKASLSAERARKKSACIHS